MLIRKKLFQSILKQDIGWFDVYKTGTLNNRLTEYIYLYKIIYLKCIELIYNYINKVM